MSPVPMSDDSENPVTRPNHIDLVGWKLGVPVTHLYPTVMLLDNDGDPHMPFDRVEVSLEIGPVGSESGCAGAPLFLDGKAYAPHIRLRMFMNDTLVFSIGMERDCVTSLRQSLERELHELNNYYNNRGAWANLERTALDAEALLAGKDPVPPVE